MITAPRWNLLNEANGKTPVNIFFAGSGFDYDLAYGIGVRKRLLSWHANTDDDIVQYKQAQQQGRESFGIVDSGAFTIWNKGGSIDVNDYGNRLVEFLKWFDVAANLDVIPGKKGMPASDITPEITEDAAKRGWENFLKISDILKRNGIDPKRLMPIYHQGESIYWLKKMVDHGCDYIGVSPSNDYGTPQRRLWLDDVYSYLLKLPKLPRTHGYAVTSPALMSEYPWFCLTDEHEILTKRGWLKYSSLLQDDFVLTYQKDVAIWEKIQNIHRYDVDQIEIIDLDNKKFSASTTVNHKWLSKSYGGEEQWCETKDLNWRHLIPKVAKSYKGPDKEVHSDYLVELVAWLWTDGTIIRSDKYRKKSITIYQSDRANPENVDRIRKLLIDSKENYCEHRSNDGMIHFQLYGELTQKICHILPEKKIPIEFLLQLSERQIKLFVDCSVKADGHIRNGSFILTQGSVHKHRLINKKHNIEIFAIACHLAGIPITQYDRIEKINIDEKELEFHHYYVSQSKVPVTYAQKLKAKIRKYSGIIWCVTVPGNAFFTRKNGKITVTGNSVDSSSWIQQGGYGSVMTPFGAITMSDRENMNRMFSPDGSSWSPEMKTKLISYFSSIGLAYDDVKKNFQDRWRANGIFLLNLERNLNYRPRMRPRVLFEDLLSKPEASQQLQDCYGLTLDGKPPKGDVVMSIKLRPKSTL